MRKYSYMMIANRWRSHITSYICMTFLTERLIELELKQTILKTTKQNQLHAQKGAVVALCWYT